LQELNRLVGAWSTQATHPAMPGVVVNGSAVFEWLEGERFLINRSRSDHPDFPDATSVIGFTDTDRAGEDAPAGSQRASNQQLTMHYFDSRGVFRVYEVSIDAEAWRWYRDAPGFSQRITCRFTDGGDTMEGTSQLRREEAWEDDLAITYSRDR
jgi:hypothetical protein